MPFAPMPFVVGVPRSGTTMLRLMLDAHPQMSIPPETGFIWSAIALKQNSLSPSPSDLLKEIVEYSTWPDFEMSAESLSDRLARIVPFDISSGIRAFYELYAERFGKRRWGDKTPLYCKQMPQICELLPEARFIHLIRDGRDVALSLQKVWFAPGRDIPTLAKYWNDLILEIRSLSHQCPHFLEVRYEQLVLNPTGELRRICDFLELDYHPQMAKYYDFAADRLAEMKGRNNPDGSVFLSQKDRHFQQRLTRCPPQRDRINRWKQEMSSASQAEFEHFAHEALAMLESASVS